MPARTSFWPVRRATSTAVCAPLSGLDTAEEQQIIAAARARSELVQGNPMVDRGGVLEIGPSVSCADGCQMRRLVVSAIDGENALGGKAVDGCYDWRVDQPAVRQREKVEVVVQYVKRAGRGRLESSAHVQTLVDLGVERRV